MDDFTFPTTAASAAAAAAAADTSAAEPPLRLHLHHHRRRVLHFAGSPLWFPSCPVAAAPPAEPVLAGAVASGKGDVVRGDVDVMADKERGGGGGEERVEEEEEAMSEWSDEGRPEEVKAEAETAREFSRGGGDDDDGGDGGDGGADKDEEEEEKMDLLWEDFNEELQQALHQRVGSCPRADARAAAAAAGLELSPESSDAESEPAATPTAVLRLRGHVGCAPMMLRPSSRAGGYRRATSWVLLMKIFRRLFVIEKTVSSASGRHGHAVARR
ncbi:uncharacterized protein LOC121054244 [Oryza brachyantha]|uniref:uncharacterized protein LOC121054244 n=1 Tax=Oryza brachyantha TaxID=4533 RepID=UPI001ADA41DD|nr:uncharacterized protein LOC121054244 [Oryza brachyantha]